MTVRLDSSREVVTPEGATLVLRQAGPAVRAMAWLADTAIRAACLVGLGLLSGLLGGQAGALVVLAWFGMEWLYPVLFEVTLGTTPGKKAMKLIVLKDDGTPIDWSASMVRNTLRAADFLPFGYALGLATMLLGDGFRRLGDLAAGTVVVYREEPTVTAAVAAEAGVESLPVALRVPEQRALIDFLRRSPGIAPARVEELALAAGPLVAGLDGAGARARLLALGRGLLGVGTTGPQ